MTKITSKYFILKKLHFRLPKNLLEKMPSATNSPLIGRKSIPTIPIPGVSSNITECDVAGTSTESTEQLVSQKNRLPLSVASMVRRFERDSSSKSRAGSSSSAQRTTVRGSASGTTTDITTKYQQATTPLSSRTSSLSSSQGFLNALPGEKDGEEIVEGKDENKSDKNKDTKDNSRKSQILSSKVDNKTIIHTSGKEQKTILSAKQEGNVNEAVIRDNKTSSKTSVCHMKEKDVQSDISDNVKVEDGNVGSSTSKKTPITMTSVVRAASAPKDHQSSKEHKAALTAKRRATAPTTNTTAAVKASRNSAMARNRTNASKAETSTTSTSPPAVSSISDTVGNVEEEVPASSRKNIKNNPVRNILSF